MGKKGEASRARLIAAAEELFANRGIKATTVSAIVARAGLTQAAFYLYFKSKDDLVEELLNRFGGMLDVYVNAGSRANQVPASELEGLVTSVFTGLFRLLGANPNLTRIALQETDAGERYRKSIVSQIAGNMRRNQELGIVDKEIDPEFAAESAVATVERMILRYVIPGERSAEELGQQAARLFLNGILAGKKRIGPADERS